MEIIKKQLPEPSQSFIEAYVKAYNEGRIIKKVMVEYQFECGFNSNGTKCTSLKVNPKDNTITIKRIKDSWSREEVVELLLAERQRAVDIACEFQEEFENAYTAKINAEKQVWGNNSEKHKESLAFIKKDIANECRIIVNVISGGNALSVTLGETMRDRIIESLD